MLHVARCNAAMLQFCTLHGVRRVACAHACMRERKAMPIRSLWIVSRPSVYFRQQTAPKTQNPKRSATIDGNRKPG